MYKPGDWADMRSQNAATTNVRAGHHGDDASTADA